MYKRALKIFLCLLLILILFAFYRGYKEKSIETMSDYIKWVDFKITAQVLDKAYNYDISTIDSENHIDWIELLARCAETCGGDFKSFSLNKMDEIAQKLKDGESMEDGKYYKYYLDAYSAVLSGFVGEYYAEKDGEWQQKYGLKAFSPVAQGFSFGHYKDFGNSRSYGFSRKHLGNDLMGNIGTPIIAVESGVVEAIGWNRYGGWRLGIRSFDNMRYYYYAHLRKDFPYRTGLKEGDTVAAGDVIGYLGMTGYSTKENINNINVPHLHFGLQIIFDESQKEGNNEIWIDVYEIVEFLHKNRSQVYKNEEDKNYVRKNGFTERVLIENGG